MSDPKAELQILADIPLFCDLDGDLLQSMHRQMRAVSYTAGQAIFGRGDPGRELYVVLEGRIKVSVLTAEGRELAFTHIDAGGLFGEIALLDGGERTADATALTKVKALSLNQSAARDLMRSSPEFCENVVRFLCQRLRETDLHFEGIALHRIEVRLARYLDSLCRQAAPGQDEGHVVLKLPISQGELALLLGASRPKVNGALSMLETGGAIARTGNTLGCNVETLRLIGEIED